MMEITSNRVEHLPPEVIYHLNYIDQNPGHAVERANMLYQVSSKWSIDVWSFGVMILEIITGYPVYTSKMHLVSTANKKCDQV